VPLPSASQALWQSWRCKDAKEDSAAMEEYYDLGNYHRPVSTASPEAQLWFDRGLIWCYGFHHAESIKCFQKVTEIDPDCAMAYWGIAYASGPNYNKPWEAFTEADLTQSLEQAHTATQMALARLDGASAVEQALIRTLTHRYPSNTPADNLNIWNDAYARHHDFQVLTSEVISTPQTSLQSVNL
jgi:tetratricopeptide (TPR) repeat protein